MKKIKLILVALFVCALGYGGYSAYVYVTMTETERYMLANVEALTDPEPGGGGDGEVVGSCPNGGYTSKGDRTSKSGSQFELFKISGGIKVTVGIYPSKLLAINAAQEMGINYEITAFSWVEYNCDKMNNDFCLVCNRYRL